MTRLGVACALVVVGLLSGCSIKEETPDPSAGCNDVLMDLSIGRADGNPLGTPQMILDVDVSTDIGEEILRCEGDVERCEVTVPQGTTAFLTDVAIAGDASSITMQFTKRPTTMNVIVAVEGSTQLGNQAFDTTPDETNCPNHYAMAIQ